MSSRANSASLIPQSLEARPKQSPNMLHPGSRTGSRLSNYGVRAVATPSSAASRSRKSSPPQTPHEDPKLEIKDLVKDAVREYFDALNLPQMIETHRELTNEAAVPQQQYPGYGGFTDEEQVWAVVHKDPLSEIMNSTQPRPTSRQLVTPAQGLTRSKTQYWKDESEFQTKLEDWASTASQHEQEIVKNLLTKLNGGVAPEVKARPINENSKPKNRLRRSYSGAVGAGKKVIPAQYQCDLSMFTKPPYNPQRHFTINPEWTSERYTVKKIPAAHLHPSASLKNKLGLLRS